MKSPQQAIYDAVFKTSVDLGYDTYNYLPPKDVSLPFVYVGEQFSQDEVTKTFIYGNVQQTINVYGNVDDRRQVSDMVNALKYELRRLTKTNNYYITVKSINDEVLTEDVSDQKLYRGIIEVEFRFN